MPHTEVAASTGLDNRARLTGTALEDRVTPVSGPTNLVAAGISDAFEAVSSGTDGIIRISGSSGTLPATLNLSYGGTAVNGVDYSAPTTFVFPSKASYVDIPITPIHNSTATGTLTVTLTIGSGAAYTIGGHPTDGIKVFDIDNPQVTVAKQGSDPTEGGNGAFRITRSGSTSGNLTVNFSVGGTATSGTDYTSIGTSATITSGNSYVDVTDGGGDGRLHDRIERDGRHHHHRRRNHVHGTADRDRNDDDQRLEPRAGH